MITALLTTPRLLLQRESARDFWLEALPLFEAHLAEMPHLLDEPLDLDLDGYFLAEDRDLLRCYTARSGVDLIGYGIYFVHPHLWHRGRRDAGQHALYVQPTSRGTTGVRLIRFIERSLKAEGVRVCRQHVHPGRREGALFARLGYELMHEEFEKRL